MEWLDIIPDSVDMNLSTFCQIVEDTEAWSAAAMESQREGRDVATEQQLPMFQVRGLGCGWKQRTSLSLC